MTRAFLLALLACNGSDKLEPNPGDGPPPPDTDLPTPPTDTDTQTTPPLPEVCDAGTAAWVQRVFPLVVGRKVHGAGEVADWVWIADTYGRGEAVRALTYTPGYYPWWKLFFTDALYVARTGDKEFAECFDRPELLVHDGALTQHIRGNAPDAMGGFSGGAFNMADVIVDALVADDLSVIYQAHLFARMEKPTTGANVSEEELEYNRRVNFGSLFLDTYTNRDLVCVVCHNSEFSVTPDRTYGTPGLYEKAIFGQSWGRDPVDDVYAMFKYHDVVDGGGGRPWGMEEDCGEFNRTLPAEDYLGQTTQFFVEEYDATGSVWDVEASFAAGAAAISGVGVTVNPDLSVEGNSAFAWLVAQNVADQVWQYAFGPRLTIAYGFGRNPEQAERLTDLTDALVTGGWSLRELLVSVATDPYFNAGLPETCPSQDYGMAPVFDAYTDSDPDPAKTNNGTGDIVHRHTARALMRSAHDALGWPPAEEYHGSFGATDELDFQGALGVFLRESEPGFNGSDFQGLLAWEDKYVTCRDSSNPEDNAKALFDLAIAEGATVEELVLGLKNHLLAQGAITPEEAPLIESLLGIPLSAVVADQDPLVFARKYGLLCGALLMSPDWYLALEPLPVGPIPRLAVGRDEDCATAVDALALAGIPAECVDGALAGSAAPASRIRHPDAGGKW